MIAGGEDVGAEIEEVVGDGRGYAEAACGVLSVDDDQIGAALGDHMCQMFTNDAPAGAAEDVAYEKDPQMLLSPETKLIPDAIPRRIRRNARNAMRVNTFFYGACMRMKVRDGYEWDFMRFRLLNF
jgi:hypothetical protein